MNLSIQLCEYTIEPACIWAFGVVGTLVTFSALIVPEPEVFGFYGHLVGFIKKSLLEWIKNAKKGKTKRR